MVSGIETETAVASYLIMHITITDEDRWAAYRDAVLPLIEKFGGQHATKGGGAEHLEGVDDGHRIALFTFPSMQTIRAFWTSPEYRPLKALRRGAATLDVWAVPGD